MDKMLKLWKAKKLESQKADKTYMASDLILRGTKLITKTQGSLHLVNEKCVFIFCENYLVNSSIITFNFKPTSKTSSVWNLYKQIPVKSQVIPMLSKSTRWLFQIVYTANPNPVRLTGNSL